MKKTHLFFTFINLMLKELVMSKLQAWIMVTIAWAIVSVIGLTLYPPVGLGGIVVTVFAALWTAAVYEEEIRL